MEQIFDFQSRLSPIYKFNRYDYFTASNESKPVSSAGYKPPTN